MTRAPAAVAISVERSVDPLSTTRTSPATPAGEPAHRLLDADADRLLLVEAGHDNRDDRRVGGLDAALRSTGCGFERDSSARTDGHRSSSSMTVGPRWRPGGGAIDASDARVRRVRTGSRRTHRAWRRHDACAPAGRCSTRRSARLVPACGVTQRGLSLGGGREHGAHGKEREDESRDHDDGADISKVLHGFLTGAVCSAVETLGSPITMGTGERG